jgi:ferredoxin-NADP reductase
MPAREVACKVVEFNWLTPTVMGIRFEPSKKFVYEPGQFLSVVVPDPAGGRPLRRAYSFASPPGKDGYQLCVKHVPGGPGSGYLAKLKVGDVFKAFAPYGDFMYVPRPGRKACFISTGTGIAPFRAMVMSDQFRENPPEEALNLFGVRTADEIIYPGLFEGFGVKVVNAVSKPPAGFKGFQGRVTDYLKSLPSDWDWHATDFYLCGNGDMVAEVVKILRSGHGVPEEAIHKEVYFVAPDRLKQAA